MSNLFKKGSFIVSCQALEHEELFGEGIMTKMAKAAINGGADAIRTSQIHNVTDIMKNLKDVVVIGLIKEEYEGSDVYITPTSKEMMELIETGVHVIAIDATDRKRPKESLEELVKFFNENKKPNQYLMADCATIEDIENANRLGIEYAGTTLRGYTAETKGKSNVENNYEFLRLAKEKFNGFLIAEGGFNTPKEAADSLKIADAVVVGSAITRPKFIVEMFVNEMKK